MPTVYSELVDQGPLFDRAYELTSLCCPSRSEILTGLDERHRSTARRRGRSPTRRARRPPGTCRRRHACPSHRENRRSAEAPSTPPRRTAPRPRPTTAARASSFEGGVARVVSGPAAPPTNSAMLTAGARRRNTPAIHPLAKAHTAKVTPSTDWWIIGRAWRSVPAAGRRERLASQEGHACGPKVCSGGRDRTSIPGSKGPCLAIRRPRRAAPSYVAAPR